MKNMNSIYIQYLWKTYMQSEKTILPTGKAKGKVTAKLAAKILVYIKMPMWL